MHLFASTVVVGATKEKNKSVASSAASLFIQIVSLRNLEQSSHFLKFEIEVFPALQRFGKKMP